MNSTPSLPVQSIAPESKKYKILNNTTGYLSFCIGKEEFAMHARDEASRPLTEDELLTAEVAQLLKWQKLKAIEIKE